MTRDEQLAWLKLQADCGCPEDSCPHTGAAPPDPVTAAAMRIVDEYGWFYDPPLGPDEVLRIVELAIAEPVPTVNDAGQPVRMERWAPPAVIVDGVAEVPAHHVYRAVPVDETG